MSDWPRLALQGREMTLKKKTAERSLKWTWDMFAIPLSIYFASQRHVHIWSTELLGLERFLTLWRVCLHHIREVSAALDLQGTEVLLDWLLLATDLLTCIYPHHPVVWPCL